MPMYHGGLVRKLVHQCTEVIGVHCSDMFVIMLLQNVSKVAFPDFLIILTIKLQDCSYFLVVLLNPVIQLM
jgi:hypothetical protein